MNVPLHAATVRDHAGASRFGGGGASQTGSNRSTTGRTLRHPNRHCRVLIHRNRRPRPRECSAWDVGEVNHPIVALRVLGDAGCVDHRSHVALQDRDCGAGSVETISNGCEPVPGGGCGGAHHRRWPGHCSHRDGGVRRPNLNVASAVRVPQRG